MLGTGRGEPESSSSPPTRSARIGTGARSRRPGGYIQSLAPEKPAPSEKKSKSRAKSSADLADEQTEAVAESVVELTAETADSVADAVAEPVRRIEPAEPAAEAVAEPAAEAVAEPVAEAAVATDGEEPEAAADETEAAAPEAEASTDEAPAPKRRRSTKTASEDGAVSIGMPTTPTFAGTAAHTEGALVSVRSPGQRLPSAGHSPAHPVRSRDARRLPSRWPSVPVPAVDQAAVSDLIESETSCSCSTCSAVGGLSTFSIVGDGRESVHQRVDHHAADDRASCAGFRLLSP